jgi:hypothetical protein
MQQSMKKFKSKKSKKMNFHKYEESVQELDYEIDALTKKLAKEIEEESK